jgi:MFS family permease
LSFPYTIGVFIEPLNAEFGWSRAQILTAGSVVSLSVGGLSLLVGWLSDRMNVRTLIISSQIAFGLAFMVMAVGINNLPSFYGLYFLMSVAGMATSAVPFAKLITADFVQNRGLALGIAMSGTGFCALVAPPYAAHIVETFGWRAGYMAIGLLPLVLAMPASLLFIRNPDLLATPGENVASPGRTTSVQSRTSYSPDNALRSAISSYRFWVLFTIFTLGSSVMTMLLTNFIPILGDRGYSPTLAATMAGSFGITLIAGRIGVGYLIDRFWAPLIGCIVFVPATLAVTLLAALDLGTWGLVIAILMIGLAAGSEVDLMGYLVSRYYGLLHFGKIFAGVYIGFALIPGLITPFFGATRDHYGSYVPGLYLCAIALLIISVLFLTLGPYPNKVPGDAE